jgi:hypothetical protein
VGGDDASRRVSDRTLTAGDVEAIADAIAERVAAIVGARSMTFGLVDARELAEQLGVSIDFVYAHATELGAMRLGSALRRGSGSISMRRAGLWRRDARGWRTAGEPAPGSRSCSE